MGNINVRLLGFRHLLVAALYLVVVINTFLFLLLRVAEAYFTKAIAKCYTKRLERELRT
jgi:hypothetical protein